MVDVVLVAPQIAANTGNIVRLCANVGATLHLVEPLGFSLDDRALRRAGLDYHEISDVHVWESWAACRAGAGRDRRWWATTSLGSGCRYDEVDYRSDDVLVFGCESTGLPDPVRDDFPEPQRLRIPMRPQNRSLNLANALSVVVYEAWRQAGFDGAAAGTFSESLRGPASQP